MAQTPVRTGARAPLLLLASLLALPLSACNCGEVVLPGEEPDVGKAQGDSAVPTLDAGEQPDTGEGTELDAGEAEFDAGEGEDAGEAADAGEGDVGTTCPPIECTGKCGPIRDFCSGEVTQCPACLPGLVCSLDTHVCIQPARTCAELGAECGQIRNSCGVRLNCGACQDVGEECDRNTHLCVPCTDATCADMGYECGQQWLGCGPFSHLTDCGTCAAGSTCNSGVCEQQCTPPDAATLCSDAPAECGFISDGCGGKVDCGTCPAGTSCGARGIGNRCDLPEYPDECIGSGRSCGPLVSACGDTLDCGKCEDPDICWPDGHCAPPCVPKTCTTEYLGKCGIDLPEGCTAGLTVDCGCIGGEVCTTATPGQAGTCVTPSGCEQFDANGQPGEACSNAETPAFPKGDGTNLACPCSGAALCLKGTTEVTGEETGTCCLNTLACPTNTCATTVKNACTGEDIVCACGAAGTHCNTPAKQCEPDHSCATYGAGGAPGNACSNGPSADFPKNNTPADNLTCACQGSAVCVAGGAVVTGGASGTCCVPDTCPSNTCVALTDKCTGKTINCSCTAGNYCKAEVCASFETCATYGATGQSTKPCSVGASPDFPKGDGSNLSCPCNAGGRCNKPGTTQLADPNSLKGECCFNTVACAAGECNTSKTNPCTGATITCACTVAGQHCNNATNKCEADNGCSAFTNGQAGSDCSNGASPAFPKGDGTNLTCACSAPGAQCFSGGSPLPIGSATKGTCCIPDTCAPGTCGTITDHCSGATITCGCTTPGTHCNTGTGLCEANLDCAAYSALGRIGDICSNGPSFSNGGTPPTLLTCACSGTNVLCSNGTSVVTGTGCGTAANPCPQGTCCQNTVTCGANPNMRCNVTLTNSCTGAAINCGCGSNYYCDKAADGICRPYVTCGNQVPPANGVAGAPCSTSANVEFERWPTPPGNCSQPGCPADAVGQTCGCTGGRVCSVAGAPPHLAGAGEVGACCANTAVCGTQCNVTLKNTCTNANIVCSCTGSNWCDTGVNTCKPYATCATLGATGAVGSACSNGNDPTDFPRFPTDTTGLTCACLAGNCYKSNAVVTGATGGNCCTPPTLPAGNVGDACTSILDPCTNTLLPRPCKAANYCKSGVCAALETCTTLGATGAVGKACSTNANPAFPRGDGTNLTCGCTSGLVCSEGGQVAGPGELGACCQPPVIPAGNVGDACTQVLNTCTGVMLDRPCKSGNYCKSGTCAAYETCSTLGANGASGQTCSNGNAFDRGDGTLITCPCTGSGLCLVGSAPVSGATKGTCCFNTAVCPANTCAPLTNTCTGATITCTCSANNHCNGSGATATCSVNKTCADYNATGAVGKPCSAGATSAFPDGPLDANLTCNCTSAAPYTNNACVGWNATTAGTCTCVPTAPANCGDNGTPDGCGGTMVSTCTPTTQVCYQDACCVKPVCAAGNQNDACGPKTACGITLPNCPCTQQYMTCGAVSPGVCGCKPLTLDDCGVTLPLGQTSPNGCGGFVTCPG